MRWGAINYPSLLLLRYSRNKKKIVRKRVYTSYSTGLEIIYVNEDLSVTVGQKARQWCMAQQRLEFCHRERRNRSLSHLVQIRDENDGQLCGEKQ